MPEDERTGPPQRSALATPPDEYDSPWKEVSGRFFPQLVEYFAPDVYGKIDWSAGYDFLEQELREVLRDSETGPRRVDKVVKVQTLTGKPLYLVLHIEIQASREVGLPAAHVCLLLPPLRPLSRGGGQPRHPRRRRARLESRAGMKHEADGHRR